MPIDPIEPIDYPKVGKQLLEWSQDPAVAGFTILDWSDALEGSEANLAILKKALSANEIDIPARYNKVIVIQGDNNTFILRLPPKDQAAQSAEGIEDDRELGRGNDPKAYMYPKFYNAITDGSFDNKSFFHSRIADYTIRGCR